MIIALALFFGRVQLPAQLDDAVSLLSKMCTPLCMLILGMRLAIMPKSSAKGRTSPQTSCC